MRVISCVIAFVLCGASGGAQQRDVATVVAELRQALGGAATLDAVRTLSASGTVKTTHATFTKSMSIELFALLPDHFMEVRRDWNGGPVPIDITYYNGHTGDSLIRRTDANIPFPDPFPRTPESDRAGVLQSRRELARLSWLLLGRPDPVFPFDVRYLGPQQYDGRPAERLDAVAPDGYVMHLFVDAATHLPAAIEWEAEQPVVFTTSSSTTIKMRGNEVVSRSEPAQGPSSMSGGGAIVTWRLIPSKFQSRDGVTWPRRIQVISGTAIDRELSFDRFRINPKLDVKKFDVGR